MDGAQHIDAKALTKGEYETQFFGFSSSGLFVHLKDNLNEIFNVIATNLQEALVKKRGSDENEVKSATSMLIQKCESVLLAHCDDLQVACDTNFGIPEYVLLPEDNAQEVQYSNEEAENLERQLDCHKIRLTRARAMKSYLSNEIEEFEKVKPMVAKMQNQRLKLLNDLLKDMMEQKRKLKRLSKISQSIKSVTSKTEVAEPHVHLALIQEKFHTPLLVKDSNSSI